MRRLLIVIGLLCIPAAALAQDMDSPEIIGGYSYLNADGGDERAGRGGLFAEGKITVTSDARRRLRVGFSTHSGSTELSNGVDVDQRLTLVTGQFCPTVISTPSVNVMPCGGIGVAMDHQEGSSNGVSLGDASAKSLAVIGGVLIEHPLGPMSRFCVVGGFDLVFTNFADNWQTNLRIQGGVGVKLGAQ